MNSEQEQNLVAEIKKYVTENLPLSKISDEELEERVEEIVTQKIGNLYCSIDQRVSIVQQVYSSIRGFGLLDSIISDDSITEVMINGPDNIFIEQNGHLYKLEKKFESQRRLEDVIQRIVGLAGREVNQANPICDTRLPDGSRVNVVLPPIALCGPTMTIRKFSKTPMTIEKLIAYGSITQEIADKLELLVKAKYNIFISGGTGSGKTTFLNALSNYIPKDERVITIEDSAELQITGIDNLVSLETRNANASGAGQITIRDLIKSSLRMRPERIVVGEVRGGEALDMLQAMNTGHDGSLSTGHANSTQDMLSRLETMVLQGAAGLPLEAIRQQIASAVDIIIHLSRLRDKSRKTMEITEVVGYENGNIVLNPLYVFEEDENSTLEKVSGRLKRTKNPMKNDFKLLLAGIVDENGQILIKHSVPTYKERPTDEIVADMASLAKKLIAESGLNITEFSSVGIGCPGTIDSKSGEVVYSNNIPMEHYPMAQRFKEHLNLPVIIDNDANCAALGEYTVNGNEAKVFILITLGTGVGSGVIINGKIFHGFNGAAAELGHITLVSGGKKCTCGKEGCLESYASATALIEQTKVAMSANNDSIMHEIAKNEGEVSGRTAFDAAKQGDNTAIEVVNNYARYLADGLVSIENAFQPEVIAIGGGISKESEYLLKPVREYVQNNGFNKYMKKTEIVAAKLFNDAGIIGAAML